MSDDQRREEVDVVGDVVSQDVDERSAVVDLVFDHLEELLDPRSRSCEVQLLAELSR